MIAFHNDKKIKAKYLSRVRAHQKADEIIKGQYWQNGKGCAVGCTIHSGNHADYETELGIPRLLARLEDGIFEALPNDLAKTWPARFLSAIKVGANLEMVWPQFAEWLLTDSEFGVIQFAKTDAQREAIQRVADLYTLKTAGADIDVNDWIGARDAAAADAAAAYAADAAAAAAYAAYAADAAAAYAAYAADAAAANAAYAANAANANAAYAANAANANAARTKFRIAQSEKLLELLRASKPKGGADNE